jgi:hypothetical protein
MQKKKIASIEIWYICLEEEFEPWLYPNTIIGSYVGE